MQTDTTKTGKGEDKIKQKTNNKKQTPLVHEVVHTVVPSGTKQNRTEQNREKKD